MKLIPMLFSTPMVLALLAGTKTQTRRNVSRLKKFGAITELMPSDSKGYDFTFRDKDARWHDVTTKRLTDCSPVGKVGNVIWGRETWRIVHINYKMPISAFYTVQFKDFTVLDYNEVADMQDYLKPRFKRDWDSAIGDSYGAWKPSLFMPMKVCRLFLEVTNIRAEHLLDISEADARAEGITLVDKLNDGVHYHWEVESTNIYSISPQMAYYDLWDSINGPASHRLNPYVWAYDFKRIKKP